MNDDNKYGLSGRKVKEVEKTLETLRASKNDLLSYLQQTDISESYTEILNKCRSIVQGIHNFWNIRGMKRKVKLTLLEDDMQPLIEMTMSALEILLEETLIKKKRICHKAITEALAKTIEAHVKLMVGMDLLEGIIESDETKRAGNKYTAFYDCQDFLKKAKKYLDGAIIALKF